MEVQISHIAATGWACVSQKKIHGVEVVCGFGRMLHTFPGHEVADAPALELSFFE